MHLSFDSFHVLVAGLFLILWTALLIHYQYTNLRLRDETSDYLFYIQPVPHIMFLVLVGETLAALLISIFFDIVLGIEIFLGVTILLALIQLTWGEFFESWETAETAAKRLAREQELADTTPSELPLTDVAKDVLYKHFTKKPDGT